MPKTTKKPKTRSNSKKKTTTNSQNRLLSLLKNRKLVLVLSFAIIGSVFIYASQAAAPAKFIRKVDTGPQASTYGHTPAGNLKAWDKSTKITDSSGTRDKDGWLVLKGYEFKSSVLLDTKKVALVDCKVTFTGGIAAVNITSSKVDQYLIDHCEIDMGTSGNLTAGIVAYRPGTIRYSHIHGISDGINIGSDSLIEHNYINIGGTGTEGHKDGIQGEYFKFNWTARHNTILSSVAPADKYLALGAEDGPERGGNIGVWAPDTPARSGKPYSGAEGVLIEDNYINGFNTGIGLMGTNPDNISIARNNTFGKNFRYYPSNRVATYDKGRQNEAPGPTNYVLVEGSVYDKKFNEATGTISNYDGSSPSPTTPEPTPEPTPTNPTPTPAPAPTPTPEPTSSNDLPVLYGFNSNTSSWEGQGNTTVNHNTTEGYSKNGSLQINVNQSGPYPDNSRTARAGTKQYGKGLELGANQTVSGQLFVKSSSARNVRCEIRFYNNNRILDTVAGSFKKTNGNWINPTCKATSPANTTHAALRTYIDNTPYGEVFYVDDAELTTSSLSEVTPTTPAPTPSSPSTPSQPTTPTTPTTPVADTKAPTTPTSLSRSLSLDFVRFRYKLDLSWKASSDNSSEALRYIISRNGENIGFTTNTSFSDNTIQAGPNYSYTVKAQDASGNTSKAVSTSAKASCFLIWCSLE